MSTQTLVIPWSRADTPSERLLHRLLLEEGLSPMRWTNGPGDRYPTHTHSFNKVLVVVQGSITFGLPDSREEITLNLGDRLELPAGVSHNALVGPRGVACLEAHIR